MNPADVWSDRAELYRDSAIHASGDDLDLTVAWCEPGPGVTVLDVATGGGHVARRLREAGCSVVTVDPAPGMQADVIAPAEDLPFADASFDAVACRLAAHHFPDVLAALTEMARVARDRVVGVVQLGESGQRPAAQPLGLLDDRLGRRRLRGREAEAPQRLGRVRPEQLDEREPVVEGGDLGRRVEIGSLRGQELDPRRAERGGRRGEPERQQRRHEPRQHERVHEPERGDGGGEYVAPAMGKDVVMVVKEKSKGKNKPQKNSGIDK